jgi:hypothetical protein
MALRILGFLREKRATAAIEFALIVPVLLLLIAGIAEFGGIFQVYNAVNRLASQYAIAWADCVDSPTPCSVELATYTPPLYAIQNIFPQLSNFTTRGSLRMFQIHMSGSTPVIDYQYPLAVSLTTAETALAQSTFTDGQSGVIVTASYTYTPVYFPTIMNSILAGHFTPTYTVAQLKS